MEAKSLSDGGLHSVQAVTGGDSTKLNGGISLNGESCTQDEEQINWKESSGLSKLGNLKQVLDTESVETGSEKTGKVQFLDGDSHQDSGQRTWPSTLLQEGRVSETKGDNIHEEKLSSVTNVESGLSDRVSSNDKGLFEEQNLARDVKSEPNILHGGNIPKGAVKETGQMSSEHFNETKVDIEREAVSSLSAESHRPEETIATTDVSQKINPRLEVDRDTNKLKAVKVKFHSPPKKIFKPAMQVLLCFVIIQCLCIQDNCPIVVNCWFLVPLLKKSFENIS